MDPVFIFLASFILISAFCVILQEKLIKSSIALMLCFLGLALAYFSFGAIFVGIAQILIYAVGVGLLIIFSIMLLKNSEENKQINLKGLFKTSSLSAFIACNLLFSLISICFLGLNIFENNISKIQSFVDMVSLIRQNGLAIYSFDNFIKILFQDQILSFELISVLLLIAFIGAILISQKTKIKN